MFWGREKDLAISVFSQKLVQISSDLRATTMLRQRRMSVSPSDAFKFRTGLAALLGTRATGVFTALGPLVVSSDFGMALGRRGGGCVSLPDSFESENPESILRKLDGELRIVLERLEFLSYVRRVAVMCLFMIDLAN